MFTSLPQSFPLLLLLGNSGYYRQNQTESIQFLWPFFNIVLTVRTAVPFVSSVGHVMSIWTVKSKFHFDHMPKLHAFHKDLRRNNVNVNEKQL